MTIEQMLGNMQKIAEKNSQKPAKANKQRKQTNKS